MVSKLAIALFVLFAIVSLLCNVDAATRRRRSARRRSPPPPPDTRRRAIPPSRRRVPTRRRLSSSSDNSASSELMNEIIAEMVGATFSEVLARSIDAIIEAGNPDELTEEDAEELLEENWDGPMY